MIENHSNKSVLKQFVQKLTQLFQAIDTYDKRRSSSVSSKSSSILSSTSETSRTSRGHYKKKLIVKEEQKPNGMKLPPFSPTYCKTNEFPYSNFYVKLPDGKWMIKYRSGNRDNLGTDIMEGYMI